MTRLETRQAFICILAGFLLCGLTYYGLLTSIVEPNQGKPLSFASSKESQQRDRESYPVPSPLGQVNERNSVFAQTIAVASLYRVPTKSTGSVCNALGSQPHNTNSEDISSYVINSPNTVLKFLNRQNCQHLDIPPPHA